MNRILLIALIMSSFVTFAQQKTVEEALVTFKNLLVNPTEKGLDAIAHKDVTYGHSSGKIENKAAFIDQLVSKRSDFRKVEFLEQTIYVEGKTAIVRHTLEAETLDGGKPGTIKIKILLVWVKNKKDWKLLARQAVKI